MKPPPYKAPPVLTAPPPALAGMKELPFKAAPGPTTHANGPPCKPPPGQKPPPCKGLPVYKPPPPGVFAKEVPYRALVLKVPPPYPQDRPEQAAVTPSAKAAEPSTAKASTATPFEVQLAETALLPPRTSWPKNRLHSPPRGNKASRVSVRIVIVWRVCMPIRRGREVEPNAHKTNKRTETSRRGTQSTPSRQCCSPPAVGGATYLSSYWFGWARLLAAHSVSSCCVGDRMYCSRESNQQKTRSSVLGRRAMSWTRRACIDWAVPV